LRKDKINSLTGNWKWISKEANGYRDDGLVGKMITSPLMKFSFELYRHSKKWELVKTERLLFLKTRFLFFYILYSNNEVWEYTINKFR
jgi:hypothetical protein